MNRPLPAPDWRNLPIAAVLDLAGVMAARLADAGFIHMRDLDETTPADRRARIALSEGQHDRVTAVLAEFHDDDVVYRCRHLGEPA